MTAQSQAVDRFSADGVTHYAKPKEWFVRATDYDALTARVRELEAALRDALAAAEYLAEMNDIEYGSPGDCVDLCGIRVCDACGCLAGKIDRARAALAEPPKAAT